MHPSIRRSTVMALTLGVVASVALAPNVQAQDASPQAAASEAPSTTFHLDTELEATFPETIGGEPLSVQSMTGDQLFVTAGEGSEEMVGRLEDVLTGQGKSLADLSIALAFTPDMSVSVTAFQVEGGDAAALAPSILGVAGEEITQTPGQVAGKDVTVVTDSTGSRAYFYAQGDTLWFVTAEEPLLSEVLAALP